MEKRIEMVQRRVGDLKLDFGNPRKIKKQKREDLEESLDKYGDFDIIVINDKDQVIGGNQRVTNFPEKEPGHDRRVQNAHRLHGGRAEVHQYQAEQPRRRVGPG